MPSLRKLKSTIVIKTILRPWKVFHGVKTIHEHWPNSCDIIVADDSPPSSRAINHTFKGEPFPQVTKYINLPFDVGLSAGRNAAVDAVDTELVILWDDDFFLDKHHPLEEAQSYFLNSGLDLMGFCLKNPKYEKKSLFQNTFQVKNGVLIRKIGNHGTEMSHIRCDMCFNCFIARKSFLQENPWDPKMKLREHWEFFYRLWKKKAKVGIYPTGHIMHGHLTRSNAQYAKLRKRGQEFMKYALKKHNLKGYTG